MKPITLVSLYVKFRLLGLPKLHILQFLKHANHVLSTKKKVNSEKWYGGNFLKIAPDVSLNRIYWSSYLTSDFVVSQTSKSQNHVSPAKKRCFWRRVRKKNFKNLNVPFDSIYQLCKFKKFWLKLLQMNMKKYEPKNKNRKLESPHPHLDVIWKIDEHVVVLCAPTYKNLPAIFLNKTLFFGNKVL